MRTTLLVVALFLTTTATQAVFAQTDDHSSMEVDFGVLGTDGSCDDSSDESDSDDEEERERFVARARPGRRAKPGWHPPRCWRASEHRRPYGRTRDPRRCQNSGSRCTLNASIGCISTCCI